MIYSILLLYIKKLFISEERFPQEAWQKERQQELFGDYPHLSSRTKSYRTQHISVTSPCFQMRKLRHREGKQLVQGPSQLVAKSVFERGQYFKHHSTASQGSDYQCHFLCFEFLCTRRYLGDYFDLPSMFIWGRR